MRVRLRPGVHYAPVVEGLYVGTPRTHFVIRGPRVLYRMFDELIPLLEDGATEDEVIRALRDIAGARLVRQVIAALRDRNLLLDLARLSEPEPDADTRRRHAGALADLEADSDDPYAAFSRLRAARVLLAGPPTAVLPAARGLLRAGVTRLLLALPEPSLARALADRAPGVEVMALADGKIASEPGGVDAAMYVASDVGLLDLQRAELGDDCPTVPVLAGGPLVVVGPPVRGSASAAIWPELCARANSWHLHDAPEPVAMPAGEALAGALAGQAIFRTLTGTGRRDEAHVIYGGTLTAVALPIAGARERPGACCGLDQVLADQAPSLSETLAAVHAASARWLGRFTIITPEDLPQIPVCLVTAEHLAAPGGKVLAWGREQETATCAVGLACLRAQAGVAAARGDGEATVGAAGTTRARWLLDGALRLLEGHLQPDSAPGYADIDDLDSRRLWRAIEDYELVPVAMRTYRIADVGWRLGTLVRTDTSETLARAWAMDGPDAIRAALATGIARLQAHRALGRDLGSPDPDMSALISAPDAGIAALLAQVTQFCRHRGIRIAGSAAGDPLLGALDLWHGAVRLRPAASRAGAVRPRSERGRR